MSFEIFISSYQNFTEINNINSELYQIILLEDDSEFLIDFTNYKSYNKSLIFLSPFQNFSWVKCKSKTVKIISFHGDFYCIEYHKNEVACNGLLFNNIYLHPNFQISSSEYNEFNNLFHNMQSELLNKHSFSKSVLTSYLQLILALSSKIKSQIINLPTEFTSKSKLLQDFQKLLEIHYLEHKHISYYSGKLAISNAHFSKKIKEEIGKTPSQIIQDKLILEAKKSLHLSLKSIKEIASDLGFNDEFYFSRFFKKNIGISPQFYRDKVGVSIVIK